MKFSTIPALCALAFAAATVGANADAMSDQQKAYNALGIKVGSKTPALCNLLTKSEVAKYLGKPVGDGTSAGPVVTGCAWHALDGTNDGLLVTRGPRSDWHPSTSSPYFKKVTGIGEKAYTDFTPGLGHEADALNSKGVTIVQFSGKANAAAAVNALRIAASR